MKSFYPPAVRGSIRLPVGSDLNALSMRCLEIAGGKGYIHSVYGGKGTPSLPSCSYRKEGEPDITGVGDSHDAAIVAATVTVFKRKQMADYYERVGISQL